MNEVLMRKVLPAGLGSALAGILSAGTVTVRPRATDEALVNPGMGWVFYKYSNRVWAYGANTPTEDALDWFPGCLTIYMRLTWNDLEPEEGALGAHRLVRSAVDRQGEEDRLARDDVLAGRGGYARVRAQGRCEGHLERCSADGAFSLEGPTRKTCDPETRRMEVSVRCVNTPGT